MTKEDYSDAVMIEPEALEEEFVRMPADLARWNQLYAEALGRHMEAKAKVDRVYARTFIKLKGAASDDDSPKRRTETDIKSAVELDVGYRAAQDELVTALVEKTRLYGVVDAIRAKRDALISIGAGRRAELHPPRIRDDSHNAEDSNDDD